MRTWHLLPLAVLAALLATLIVCWPWIDAQRRAVIVLSTVVETPVLTWAVKAVTGEPEVEEAVVAGHPATLARPSGDGPWPTIVFVNGATAEGRSQADVQSLARGLARAGYLVLVPDLPGLLQGELTEDTLQEVVDVATETAERADARKGRVGLIGVSVGGSLALIAAQDPSLAGRVSVVVAIAPYAALPNVIRLATTGYYLDGAKLKPYEADPFVGLVVARSIVSAMTAGPDRTRLERAIAAVAKDDPDPLSGIRSLGEGGFGAEGAAVLRLLANTHPTIFDGLYAELPETVRGRIERLSPLVGASQLQVPIELVTAPKDKYFPVAESEAIVRLAPHANLTVTQASGTHVIPTPSLAHPIALLQFDGFAVRALKAARS